MGQGPGSKAARHPVQRARALALATILLGTVLLSGCLDTVFPRGEKPDAQREKNAVFNVRSAEQRLENATEDFQKYILAKDRRGRELFEAAEWWFLETDNPAFFSFENMPRRLDEVSRLSIRHTEPVEHVHSLTGWPNRPITQPEQQLRCGVNQRIAETPERNLLT